MYIFLDDLCTSQVFTTELIEGVPVDKCADMDFETRCYISKLIMDLLLMEMFEFRYMQTDPNWSNFFYNPTTKQVITKTVYLIKIMKDRILARIISFFFLSFHS